RSSLVVQQLSPELGETRRVVARERDVLQPKQARILSRSRGRESYPTQKGFPSGSRMIVNVMFVPTFVSTTDAPAAISRSISASRSSVAKSRWMGYESGRDFSWRWKRKRGRPSFGGRVT